MSISHQSVGERLKWARKVADLGARELDRLAGKAEGHCSIIEARSQASAREETLRAYSSVLGVSIAWLAFGEGEQPTEEQVRDAVAARRAGKGSSDASAPEQGPRVDRSPEYTQETGVAR